MGKFFRVVFIAILLALTTIQLVAAQENVSTSSIRGYVHEDVDGDGKCENGPVVVGIPIRFVSADGKWDLMLQTGSDGTYGLAAVGHGTWTVSAQPAADWVVTSAKSVQTTVTEEAKVSLGNNFCIRKASAVTKSGTTMLPQSGAAAPLGLIIAASTGVLFIGVGTVMAYRLGGEEKENN